MCRVPIRQLLDFEHISEGVTPVGHGVSFTFEIIQDRSVPLNAGLGQCPVDLLYVAIHLQRQVGVSMITDRAPARLLAHTGQIDAMITVWVSEAGGDVATLTDNISLQGFKHVQTHIGRQFQSLQIGRAHV